MKGQETDSRQLALTFDAEDFSEFDTCREYVADRVHHQLTPQGRKRQQKSIAADMDLSPSDLKRKLAQYEGDSRRFTLDDLERFVQVTGDTRPILWLVDRYLARSQDDEIARLEQQLAELRGRNAA